MVDVSAYQLQFVRYRRFVRFDVRRCFRNRQAENIAVIALFVSCHILPHFHERQIAVVTRHELEIADLDRRKKLAVGHIQLVIRQIGDLHPVLLETDTIV